MTFAINTKPEFAAALRERIGRKWGSFGAANDHFLVKGLTKSAMQSYFKGISFPRNIGQLRAVCEVVELDINNLNLPALVSPKFHRAFGINSSDNVSYSNECGDNTTDDYWTDRGYNIGNGGKYGIIVGQSLAMRQVFDLLDNINTNPNQEAIVFITGETGTGKELIAKAVHYNGKRAQQPYHPVNITTTADTLLESTLFGYKRGAFTDAKQDSPGLLEVTGDGTLFIDEIGSLPPLAQAKLLRVLQERSFYRLGDTKPYQFKGRIVAATKEDLEQLVREKKLREDLYYRLDQVRVKLPGLKEREGDTALLFSHFIKQYNERYNTEYDLEPSDSGREGMDRYTFPGNVRELENMILKAIFSAPDSPKVQIEQIIAHREKEMR